MSYKICIGLVLVLVVVVCLWVVFRFVFDPTITGLNPKLYRQYESVQQAMTRQDVVRKMGKPSGQGPEFRLSQYEGFEKEYERAKKSNSKYYLFWETGIDITYTIGFDDSDKVTIKACGGT